jgi:hypothetical protein
VALASDGKTALIGGPGDNSHVGAVWAFRRSGSTWTQQGEKLTGSGESGGHTFFGNSVALSGDGNTALIGGPGDNDYSLESQGAAWVFTRSGATWTQQGEKLTQVGESDNGDLGFGASVALSYDGNTALVGDPARNYGSGGASFLSRSGTTWTPDGKPKNRGGEYPGEFGASVALSSDGDTALIGNPASEQYFGAAWVYMNVNPPTVTRVSPDRGPSGGGTTVTTHGTDFTGASAVRFGSTNATSFTVNSATSITAVSPAEIAGTVDVTVTTPGGISPISSKDDFAFLAKHRHKDRRHALT